MGTEISEDVVHEAGEQRWGGGNAKIRRARAFFDHTIGFKFVDAFITNLLLGTLVCFVGDRCTGIVPGRSEKALPL